MTPSTLQPNVHRLQGKPLRRWWQSGDLFVNPFKKRSKVEDPYLNSSVRAHVTFLGQLPFGMGLMYYLAGPESIKMLLLAGLAWVAMFVHLRHAFKKHQKILQEVTVTEVGLNVKSAWFNRQIRWDEIKDCFPIQNNFRVIACTDGEEYLLSPDLTDSEGLFDKISKRLPKPMDVYTQNLRLPDGLMDGAVMACLAIIVAGTFPVLRWLLYRGAMSTEDVITMLITAAVLVSLAVAYWIFHNKKVAQTIRLGPSGCHIKTRSGSHTIRLDQLSKVSKLGGLYRIQTRDGWFIALIDKTEPMSKTLLTREPLRLQ